MNVTSILEPIFQRDITAPGDYIGEGGLLCCGKCHTPKQTRGTGIFEGRLLPIPCACMRAEQERREAEEKKQCVEALRERCLPAKAMRGHTFEAASDGKHLKTARRYVEKWADVQKQNIGLMLWGNTGSGKSFTAHCVANALIDKGVPVWLYSAAEIVSRLSDRETRGETLEKVRTAPLLILDDVGAERGTPFAREQLCTAIEERSEAGKPLVITTNYTLEEMKQCQERELQRIFDRLRALCVPVAVVGESRRLEIGAQKIAAARALLGAEEE